MPRSGESRRILMTGKRTLTFVLSASAVLAMAVPAGAQLRAEPIKPKEIEHRSSYDYNIGHERLAGEDRYGTAIAVSKRLYADKESAEVMLASGEDFPDAIAALNVGNPGTPVPTLLTPPNELPAVVVEEIRRIASPGAVITLVGGEKAISSSVQLELAQLGFNTTRVAGANRTETAVKLADRAPARSSSVAVVSPADNFAVSIVAAAYANRIGAPHLLTFRNADSQHEVEKWMYSKHIKQVHAVGDGVANQIGLPTVTLNGRGKQEVYVDMSECYPEDKDCIKPTWLAPEPRSEQQIAEYLWKREFESTSNYVVINGERPVDGIAATQIAAALQAPILTTFSKQPNVFGSKEMSLNFRYANLMIREGARDRSFFFVGGEQALDQTVTKLFSDGL